ncbi:sugar ABC transporter permease [Mediterraneibacter sp. NSJ-55]|uniref:Sugar ABC transporter permease n=1 Tax=Mediterraneibacter hominis TaxID=2763054 RepID=A0A923LKH8_9FIRM|nr:sugar ABC transporter permease [Mediterraneibacter hominis]MBC5689914.1 sugar ABC transporter permease [Mediterraneibacter hominis]
MKGWKEKGTIGRVKRREGMTAYLFSTPAIILLIMFIAVPVVIAICYSLMDYNTLRPEAQSFIGISNYINLMNDSEFWNAFKNTVYFTVIVVPLQCGLALALALLVSKKTRGVSIFRIAFFAPTVTSMVVIAILWQIILNSSSAQGWFNAILTNLGFEAIPFLTSKATAMNSIIMMSAWQGAGYQMMIFLAGIQGISNDLYEAADMDGANVIQKFRYITMPGLKNVSKYVVLITSIQAMRLFTQPYIMTQGGPQDSTKTLVYYIYNEAFRSRKFGYACAAAVIYFVIIVILSLALKKLLKSD